MAALPLVPHRTAPAPASGGNPRRVVSLVPSPTDSFAVGTAVPAAAVYEPASRWDGYTAHVHRVDGDEVTVAIMYGNAWVADIRLTAGELAAAVGVAL